MMDSQIPQMFAFRLHPGDDPMAALERLAVDQAWEAACVLTVVGSLRRAVLRLADQPQAETFEGRFEIVSFTGIFSRHGSHAHISISDQTGRTIGGHLMAGNEVYTTAEIVLAILPGLRFDRPFDPETGYPELKITHLDEGGA